MTSSSRYRGFRYPAEVIQHAVLLYHCFSLSLRDVKMILAACGIMVGYEALRERGLGLGRLFANELSGADCILATNRIWTRCSSAFGASCITSGAPWVSTAMCSTFSCRSVVMQGPPSGSSANCRAACSTSLG